MMPVDHGANHYWSTVNVAPDPPTTGLTLRVPAPQGADFPPVPFHAVVRFPGDSTLLAGPDTAEPLRVTQIVGNILTLDREVGLEFRRAIRAGDQISASRLDPP
jgi:hypothetical protein